MHAFIVELLCVSSFNMEPVAKTLIILRNLISGVLVINNKVHTNTNSILPGCLYVNMCTYNYTIVEADAYAVHVTDSTVLRV